jgi:3D (Asp-Asp-Asp) domain-containing protein
MRVVVAILLAFFVGYTLGFVQGVNAKQPRPVPVFKVTATAYSYPGPGCWRCGNGKRMANGQPPYVGAIAVSPEAEKYMPLGSMVEINGWRYRVADRMASFGDLRIDFFMATIPAARKWGRKEVALAVVSVPDASI